MDEFENKVTTDETAETPSEPASEPAKETENETARPVVEPINGVSYYAPNAGNEQNGAIGTVALVLGIVSAASVLLCCCCGQWYITLGLGIAAVVCAIVARNRGIKNGKITAAIVLGIIGGVFGLLVAIFDLLITLTGGQILYGLLEPFFESYGISMDEFIALIESGASEAEIEQWLEQQMSDAGFVMEVKTSITTAFNSIRGYFLK